ncbi:MAG: hypothetical protein U9N48_05840 [Euryarchaeota archaeon]|nr:hypothetical protein [Euryarchaeota archaeon]
MMLPDMRPVLKREAERKLIHLTGLTVPASILLLGRDITAGLIGLALVVGLILERERLRGNIRMPAVRDHERNQVAGYIYYILGALLTVLVFEPMIALTALLMLSFGDAASGMAGSAIRGSNVRVEGGRRLKPLPVMLTILGVCLIVGYLSTGLTGLSFPVYLAGAAGATVADAVPISYRSKSIDDNLTIPLCAGGMMALASLI